MTSSAVMIERPTVTHPPDLRRNLGRSKGSGFMRALLVEDRLQLETSLAIALRDMDLTLDCVKTIADACEALKFEKFDILIVDVELAEGDTLASLRTLQETGKDVPIFVLGSAEGLDMVAAALDYGAQDFILKPIRPNELRLRLSTRLKSQDRRDKNNRLLSCGPLKLDQMTRVVSLEDTEIEMTPRERTVLEVLLRNCDVTVSKAFIASRIYSFDDEAGVNAIQIYVHRIRQKTKHPGIQIHTVRGAGYRLSET